MNIYRRIGIFLFALSAILVVLSGALTLTPGMDSFAKAFLIFSGVLVGLINITGEQEIEFLVASIALLLGLGAISIVLNASAMNSLDISFRYLALFVGSAASVVALKLIVEYSSINDKLTLKERMRLATKELSLLEETKALKVWQFIIFLAVCAVFILILLNLFFETSAYASILFAVEIVISVLFIADLFVLYKKYARFSTFVKRCWPDIIAAIPTIDILRVAKVLRLIRIMKLASRSSKITKFAKLSRGIKFFSEESGFNKYLMKKKKEFEAEMEEEAKPKPKPKRRTVKKRRRR